jgi:NAD(P)-dependent dehydrogenase (short-subunit alcohol dehydrogenase family)
VVFTHDSVADRGRAYWGAYGVSKGGALTLMRILSQELERNTEVRVNAVDPGPVRTALRLQAFPAEDREALASPEQVMWPYLYLLGEDGSRINGSVIRPGDPLPSSLATAEQT